MTAIKKSALVASTYHTDLCSNKENAFECPYNPDGNRGGYGDVDTCPYYNFELSQIALRQGRCTECGKYF